MSKKIRTICAVISLLLGLSIFGTSFASQQATVYAFNTNSITVQAPTVEVTTNISNPMNVNMHKQTQYTYIDMSNVKYGHGNQRIEGVDYIVIHSTGNPDVSAKQHATYLNTHPKSFAANYYIDDENVINTVDENTVAFHSGSMRMNKRSIGIEIIEHTDKNKQIKALQNTSDIVQKLLEKYPNAKVITHHAVTGKLCPALVYGDNPMATYDELISFLKGE